MSRKTLMLTAAAGSLALLLGAFAFQYIGGYAPCKMCLWQRWPHGAAILIGAVVLFAATRPVALAGMLAAASTSGIGFYHAGVEYKWWQGPTSCTGAGLDSSSNLLDLNAPVNLVLCDEIVWDLFGITMAGYNGMFSLVLAGIWFWAAARPVR